MGLVKTQCCGLMIFREGCSSLIELRNAVLITHSAIKTIQHNRFGMNIIGFYSSSLRNLHSQTQNKLIIRPVWQAVEGVYWRKHAEYTNVQDGLLSIHTLP